VCLSIFNLPTDAAATDPSNKKKENSLRIHFPYQIFDSDREMKTSNWRHATKKMELRKDYLNYSNAQDQEDIWLYENWFYNTHGGVIMEVNVT
jgi:hypothetical protein